MVDIHGGGWRVSQNFSSHALMVWDWQCFEYIFMKGHSFNYLINNHKSVCWKALTTLGLLKSVLGMKLSLFPLSLRLALGLLPLHAAPQQPCDEEEVSSIHPSLNSSFFSPTVYQHPSNHDEDMPFAAINGPAGHPRVRIIFFWFKTIRTRMNFWLQDKLLRTVESFNYLSLVVIEHK